VSHPNARLSVFGRQLLVSRVVVQHWPSAEVAKQLGVSRATVSKWLRRYRAEGQPGLLDRSSRPHHSPRQLPADQVSAILRARTRRRYGPHRLAPLTGHPPSTIYHALRRAGMSRLRDGDRLTAAPVRYEACHPGALLHVDHKKLGRVPLGGGHRVLGRPQRSHDHRTPVGYDHFEVFVDDASRLAAVVQVPDEQGASAARALDLAATEFAAAGIRIERVLTDNGASYRSRAFAAVLERLGAGHRWTRPYRPQTNGKAERFIRTLLDEWAYVRAYRSNAERLAVLPRYVDFYNRRRPHTAIRGLVPLAAVNNVLKHHT
jgi:transposase InsO family protein